MENHGTNGRANGVLAHAPAPLDVDAVFRGTRLLLLGGTGFLGKVFWVMLLDRYPSIGKIYLLVRSSKEQTSDERFWNKISKSEVFEPLRKKHGDAFEAFLREKIVPVDGDVGRPLCGIDPNLIASLRGEIDAVVNVAGVVDFNPPLDEALDANAFGSQNLVSLVRALGDETPLLHTSTCFVAGHRPGPIFEEDPCAHPFPRCEELGRDVWDAEREISECLDLIAQAKHRCDDAFRQSEFAEAAKKNLFHRGEPSEGRAYDEELARVRRRFVSDRLIEAGIDRATHWGWQNIYTYTKSIGEQVIARSGVRYAISRPASCESTLAFPFPGWNDGMSTSSPVVYLALKGQMQIPGNDTILDFIPTDTVCAGMVLTLAELIEGNHKLVYQQGMSDVNPATAARLGELIGLYKRQHYQKKNGNPVLNFVMSQLEAIPVPPKQFNNFGPPAISKATKETAKALKKTGIGALRPVSSALESWSRAEEKIGDILNLFAPFTAKRNGPFDCSNTRAAYARLSPEDKAKLAWTPETIDWVDWFYGIHMPAVEKWIVPELDKKLKRDPKPLRSHETLVTLLDQMAERHDISVAVSRFEADGFASLSYRELRDRARTLAAQLLANGTKKGDRIIVSAKNSPAWPIAYFGVLYAGGTVVPIDPAIELDAFTNIARESHATIAFVDREIRISDLVARDIEEVLAEDFMRSEDLVGNTPPLPEDIASLIFTSGTTGKPKGVMLTHANFTSLIAALAPIFPLNRGDRVLSVLPLHHTFEFTCGLLLPLSRGARIAYLDELNGDRLGAAMKAGHISAMVGVPALWQLLERRILSQVAARGPIAKAIFEWAGDLNRSLGKSLGLDAGKIIFGPVHAALGGNIKYLISGGAALPAETSKMFAGLGLHLTEGYGLTEAAPVLTVSKPSPRTKAGHVGKPIPGVEVKIDSPDERGVGEVIARGPNVMLGYTDEEATSRVMAPGGWLKTGDLGKFDKDGRLQIVGRLKDVIVTATGENVYPDDIENRLGTVPHILELAIVGIEKEGESASERVACLAVPAPDENVERAERMERAMRSLKDAIGKLPFGQQPSIVHLYDASLPRTATRKVKRAEVQGILRRMIGASLPPSGEEAQVSLVVQAIASVSGKPIRDAHPHASLQADLGFDSLMLTELLEVLESRGDAIDPAALTQCRTVEDVERLAGNRAARGASDARETRSASRTQKIDKGSAYENVKLPPVVQEQAKAVIGKFQDLFYGDVMKPKVSGRAFIPHNRNTIVVANHASHLDMGFVRHALGSYGEDVVSLAAQDYFFGHGLKKAMFENFTNLKSFDRKSGLRQSLRQAGEVIEEGKTVLIFPEGTRSETGEIQEFKPMVGHLALTHGVDVLPIFIGGTHAAMPKGSKLPLARRITARIGVPLRIADMRRLTAGMTPQDAAREVARLAREAVLALRDGKLLDLSRASSTELAASREHPLVTVFQELEEKFKPENVAKPVSFYFTLGGDAFAKWTVKIDPERCEIKLGKPDGGTADCVLKTSAEIFTKIVRESYVPTATEFMSGAIKSNDVALLETFQKAFQL
jgi:long-chain acyl-CoA synthetase